MSDGFMDFPVTGYHRFMSILATSTTDAESKGDLSLNEISMNKMRWLSAETLSGQSFKSSVSLRFHAPPGGMQCTNQ